jgi:hypothetical protein
MAKPAVEPQQSQPPQNQQQQDQNMPSVSSQAQKHLSTPQMTPVQPMSMTSTPTQGYVHHVVHTPSQQQNRNMIPSPLSLPRRDHDGQIIRHDQLSPAVSQTLAPMEGFNMI